MEKDLAFGIPKLTGTNYHLWAMKMEAVLNLKKLMSAVTEEAPTDPGKLQVWETTNQDAVSYLKLSLSDEQALQYAEEKNAKALWTRIKTTYTGLEEDRKIDAGAELKSLEMLDSEAVNDYIARAKGLSTKCASLGLKISDRELVFYTVRGLAGKYERIKQVLKTQREKSIEEILEVLREEEKDLLQKSRGHRNLESAYATQKKSLPRKICYSCRRPGHIARDCYSKHQEVGTDRDYKTSTSRAKGRRKPNFQETLVSESATPDDYALVSAEQKGQVDECWILDSGATSHMCKDERWFESIDACDSKIYQAGKTFTLDTKGTGTVKAISLSNNARIIISNVLYVPELRHNLLSVTCLMDLGFNVKSHSNSVLIIAPNGRVVLKALNVNKKLEVKLKPNVNNEKIKKFRSDNGLEFVNKDLEFYFTECGITHEKSVPYNPESLGKAERANRVLLDRARTLIYDSKLPLNFWAEAIAYATHVTNLTPRKGKTEVPKELFFNKKQNYKYLRVFGSTVYYHVPKALRHKLSIPGKKGIMLGYSNERRAYRIYDPERNKVIEERSVKFNEKLLGSSNLFSEDKSNDIDEFFNIQTNVEDQNTGFEFPLDLKDTRDLSETKTRGRPVGSTKEKIRELNEQRIIEDENRLLELGVRRSDRIKEKASSNLVTNIPAMNEELNSIHEHDVWDLVDKPENVKIVKSKWVFTMKENKYKARLVAAGFNQVKNRDYLESYSPVLSTESLRLLLALSAKLNLEVKFLDIKTAYLYSNLEETVYMTIPPGFKHLYGENKVCKLKRSLYGLPQSGRNWHLHLKRELEKLGLKQLASDNCIFTRIENSKYFYIGIYVDDLIVIYSDLQMYNDIVGKLSRIFEVKESKENKFLGIEINKSEKGVTLSQTEYINYLLQKHGMFDSKCVKTPIVRGEDRSFNCSNEMVNQTQYQELIGELLYLSNRTRPDLAFVMSYLSQFNHKPEKRHFNLAKRVLKYLNGTKDKKLFFSNKSGLLNAHADASWGNAENGKSFSGEIVMLGDSLILWKSNKQKTVALSTCETELVSLGGVCRELMWILNLLEELHCSIFVKKPVTISSDNQSAIDWLNSAKSSSRTRHINLKLHYVKDIIGKIIKVEYVQTDEMIADFLTKAVTFDKLTWTVSQINLID
nr:uncharacterized protein LOC107448150 [Parasteatoda tepidariorum]